MTWQQRRPTDVVRAAIGDSAHTTAGECLETLGTSHRDLAFRRRAHDPSRDRML